jgi:GNAT superfamily N-acetyltransferase
MSIQLLTHDDLKHRDLSNFTDVIYNNFIELRDEPKLLHTKDEIHKSLHDDDAVVILSTRKEQNKVKLDGFLVGKIMELDDRRKVLFISYIYVAENKRRSGLGSALMDYAEALAYKYKCNGVMLIFDTYDPALVRFYENRTYMLDINLRRFERRDVFYKTL